MTTKNLKKKYPLETGDLYDLNVHGKNEIWASRTEYCRPEYIYAYN